MKGKKRKTTAGSLFTEAKEFLASSSREIIFALLIMLAFIFIGYMFPDFLLNEQAKLFENIVKSIPTDNPISTILFIIQNNLRASAIGMFLGVLVFVPFLVLAMNGFVIGAVVNRAIETLGLTAMLRLFPHGIFELPAIIISDGIGIRIALGIFRKESLGANYRKALLVFVFIVLPLLVIAGIIEGILYYFMRT